MSQWIRRAIGLLLVSVLLCGCSAGETQEEEESVSVTEAVSSIEKEMPPEPDIIIYPAFIDQHFDKKHHTFTLYNDKSNPVSFRFTLTDSAGSTLFTSEAVHAGEDTKWDVTQRWSTSGHHELTILSTPISPEGVEGNSVSQTIKVYLDFSE